MIERLEKLERQNRRMKQAGAAVLVLAAAVLLMGQASPNRTVEANRFVLTDRSGNEQGVLMLKPSGPSFMLLDPNSLGPTRFSIPVVPRPDRLPKTPVIFSGRQSHSVSSILLS